MGRILYKVTNSVNHIFKQEGQSEKRRDAPHLRTVLCMCTEMLHERYHRLIQNRTRRDGKL